MANNLLEILIKAKDQASADIKKLQKTLKDTAADVSKLGKSMTLIGGGIATGIGFSVKEFANFEEGMSNVKAITGATGEDFDDLTTLAKEMGRTTAFTAKEASDAMKFLGMAGFGTQEIMKTLPGTLNLAAASGIELGRAADIASNVLTGFQLGAEETDRVIDVLAKTVTSSNTDMEQLSEAMKYFAPTASAFGISLEESSAAVGLLGNAGIQGSLATRALGTSLTRLTKPTDSMYEVMDQLGLSFFNSEGQMNSLSGIVGELESKLDGLTDKEKQSALATLFGAEAIQEWNVLLSEGSDGINNYASELENAGGTADKMAKTQLDNLSGAFKLLRSAISGALIEIGSEFAPKIREVAEKITEVKGKVMEWVKANPELTEKILKITAIIAGLMLVLGPLLLILPGLVTAFSLLSSLVAAVGAVFTFLLSPIGLIIIGIGLLIAAVVLIVKNWDWVKEKTLEIWNIIKEFFINIVSQIGQWTTDKFNWIKDGIINIWNRIKDFFETVWQVISDIFKFWVALIVGVVISIFEAMGIDIVEVFTTVKDFFVELWAFIKEYISNKLDELKEKVYIVLNGIKTVWNIIWSALSTYVTTKWNEIKTKVSEGLQTILGFVDEFTKPIQEAFSKLWEGVKDAASWAFEGIKDLFKGMINFIIDKINYFIRKANEIAQKGADVVGLDIPQIAEIPRLANGGIITQPTIAEIGEAGPEAVIPLNKLNNSGIGNTINIVVNGDISGEELVEKVGDALTQKLKLNSAIV